MNKQRTHLPKRLLSAVLILFWWLPATAFADSVFLYPNSDTEIAAETIQVIISASDISGKNKLLVNNADGHKEYLPTVTGSVGSQLIALTLGVNKLEYSGADGVPSILKLTRIQAPPDLTKEQVPDTSKLFYYTHPKVNLTANCIDCHQQDAKNLKQFSKVVQKQGCITAQCHPGFNKGTYLHGPFQEGSCVECHNPHGTFNSKFLKLSKAALCFSCHSEAASMVEENKLVHFPVEKGECTSCHDPHKSNLDFHLKRNSIQELCAGCHGKGVTSHEFLHDPVESGDCNACHDAHVAEYKWLLSEEGDNLCFGCHELRKEEFQSAYVHEPVKKNCTLCHDPHGSAAPFHLKSKKDANGLYVKTDRPIQELCISCHRKLDPEVVAQIEKSTYQHKPVAEGKCTTCHTPHSTDNQKQLKLPLSETCFQCHKEMKELISGSLFKHGPVRLGECAQCHLVHGSQNKKLLRTPFSSKFSAAFALENYALCWNCHNPLVVQEKLGTETGFRNGNVNLHYVHVNDPKKGRSCKTCHAMHASDQEKHIRKKVPFKRRFSIKIEFTKTATGGGCVVGCHHPRKYDRESPVVNK